LPSSHHIIQPFLWLQFSPAPTTHCLHRPPPRLRTYTPRRRELGFTLLEAFRNMHIIARGSHLARLEHVDHIELASLVGASDALREEDGGVDGALGVGAPALHVVPNLELHLAVGALE